MKSIHEEVAADALEAVENLFDSIVEKILELQGEGDIPIDIFLYDDDYPYNQIDLGPRSSKECVEILESLSDHEAPVNGREFEESWQNGLAILAQETYRNAVISDFEEILQGFRYYVDRAVTEGKIEWIEPAGVLEWDPSSQRKQANALRKLKKTIESLLREHIARFK